MAANLFTLINNSSLYRLAVCNTSFTVVILKVLWTVVHDKIE